MHESGKRHVRHAGEWQVGVAEQHAGRGRVTNRITPAARAQAITSRASRAASGAALVVLAFGAILLLSGCTRGSGVVVTEERPVSGFTQVELAGIGELLIEQGEAESLVIEAEDNILPKLQAEVSAGVLRLGTERGASISPTKPIRYRLVVTDLSAIKLSGSADLIAGPLAVTGPLLVAISGSGDVTLDKVTAQSLDLTISGAGKMAVGAAEVRSVALTISGSGSVRIAGGTDDQNITISGSGNYEAGDLQSATAAVRVSGSGSITLWVTDDMSASISGSGNVSYYGSPRIDFTGGGSGTIRSLGDK